MFSVAKRKRCDDRDQYLWCDVRRVDHQVWLATELFPAPSDKDMS